MARASVKVSRPATGCASRYMPTPMYSTPSSNCQTIPPIRRSSQANHRCPTPANTSSQATTRLTASPAASGSPIARIPATIISTLIATAQLVKCFTSVVMVEVAIAIPPRKGLRVCGQPTLVAARRQQAHCSVHAALLFAEDGAGDDQALDFAGAFADGAELHVAVKLLRGIVLDEAVAAENLHGFVGHAHGGLAGVELGHAGLLGITNRAVRGGGPIGEPGGAIDQAARGGDLRGHVRELELNGLEFADGLAELFAFLGVFRGGVAGALSHAQRQR